MNAAGHDLNATVHPTPYDASYALDPALRASGRDGSAPGPEDVAAIHGLSRYGPDARPWRRAATDDPCRG